jgi:hypothetical protein
MGYDEMAGGKVFRLLSLSKKTAIPEIFPDVLLLMC